MPQCAHHAYGEHAGEIGAIEWRGTVILEFRLQEVVDNAEERYEEHDRDSQWIHVPTLHKMTHRLPEKRQKDHPAHGPLYEAPERESDVLFCCREMKGGDGH